MENKASVEKEIDYSPKTSTPAQTFLYALKLFVGAALFFILLWLADKYRM